MKPLVALAVLFSAAAPLRAQVSYPPRPGEREFVHDEAALVTEEDEERIRKLCDRALTEKKAPIIVVTINSLADYNAGGWQIERYAMNLMAEWGVGWGDWNYGMLLLVAVKERKARIELGAQWGHRKDREAQRIMNELIVPRFKDGAFSEGIVKGVEGLQALALDLPVPRGQVRHRRPGGVGCGSFGGIFFILIIVLVVGSMFRGGRGWGGGGYGMMGPMGMGCLGGMLGSMFMGGFHRWGGGYGGGGGFGGFSGGGFGGGFSGGGGATGSW